MTTDPVAYYSLKHLALDDPHAFLDVDLHDHLGEIDATDLATLDRLQQSLRSDKHDPQHNLERVYKDNIDRSLRGADLSATDAAHIYRQIDRDLAGHQAATGRKATPAEQQKMADQAVIDMKLDQRGFAMSRYGGIMPKAGGAANANSLIIRTAGGDMQLAENATIENARPNASDVPSRGASVTSKDLHISDEERKMAVSGNAEGFWRSRLSRGDPIAVYGLQSLHPVEGLKDALFGGESINRRLEAFSRVYAGHGADLNAIRNALMKAHIEAVDKDDSGVIGLLSPGQTYDYHKKVFEEYGLPSTAFGGSPFTGSRDEAQILGEWLWCTDCDK